MADVGSEKRGSQYGIDPCPDIGEQRSPNMPYVELMADSSAIRRPWHIPTANRDVRVVGVMVLLRRYPWEPGKQRCSLTSWQDDQKGVLAHTPLDSSGIEPAPEALSMLRVMETGT